MQEVSTEREIEIPEEVRQVYAQWRPAPLFRARRLEKALDTPAQNLLQVRGRKPRRLAQAQHRRGPGLLQQGGRNQAPGDRNRRRTVGFVAGHGVRLLRPRVQGLHGARELQPEALPARADGSLRRQRHRQPQHRNRIRPRHSRRNIRIPTARSASPSPKPSKSRPRTPTPSTPWAAC